MSPEPKRVLVAGVGNVLRCDDGFGPAVVRALEAQAPLPPGVKTLETGIGSVALVLELAEGYDALILVDAVDRGGPPGSLYVLQPEVPLPDSIPPLERWEWSNDTCQTLPSRALVMARALGALPRVTWIIGCQPAETEEFMTELSPTVEEAVPKAVKLIQSLLFDLETGYLRQENSS